MMISPWSIYWILQLDSIRDLLSAGIFLSGISLMVVAVMAPILFDNYSDFKLTPKQVFRPILGCLVFCGVAYSVTPSTKTAAAMVIIPAIANNETLQKEAADLYGLAKQALTEAIKPDDEPKK